MTPPLTLPCVSPAWSSRQSVLPIVGCGVPPVALPALDREMDAWERQRCGRGGGSDTRLRALGLLRSSAAVGGHGELKVQADRRPLMLLLHGSSRFWDVVAGGQLLPVMRLARGCGACGPCCSCCCPCAAAHACATCRCGCMAQGEGLGSSRLPVLTWGRARRLALLAWRAEGMSMLHDHAACSAAWSRWW